MGKGMRMACEGQTHTRELTLFFPFRSTAHPHLHPILPATPDPIVSPSTPSPPCCTSRILFPVLVSESFFRPLVSSSSRIVNILCSGNCNYSLKAGSGRKGRSTGKKARFTRSPHPLTRLEEEDMMMVMAGSFICIMRLDAGLFCPS